MPKNKVMELPEYTHTTKIMYASAPLRLNGVLEEITIDDLYKKVGQTFIYSNALFSEEQHAPYMKQDSNSKTTPSNTILQKFQQLGFTDITSFVICNMGSLGHGVFAKRDFEVGECFILYSGIIKEKSNSDNDSNYAFSYDNKIKLSVDAAETGNISRFIQHMPLNYKLFSKHLQENTRSQNKAQLENDKEIADFWQWQNIDYKAGLKEEEVAWANLSIIVVPIKGVPCIIFYNTQKINKGDQLGISYGTGYWIGRNVKPELFDLKGNIIPKINYGYKEIIINLSLIEYFNKLPNFQQIGIVKKYNASMFQKDLLRQQELMQPVWFSHLAEPVSIFKLRELLLHYNVLGKEYESEENDFVAQLRNILPKEFTLKLYARNPKLPSSKSIFDLVCTTEDLMKWSQLTALIKGPTFAQKNIPNKCLKFTQEIIIMDIGNNVENQLFTIYILTLAKHQGIFTKILTEDLIPSGPTRKDPSGIIMATTEESICQILFHNPGLTRQEINHAYKLVEIFTDPKDNPTVKNDLPIIDDKEVRLNTITSSFFNKGLPAKWKVYPSDQLRGQYIGHQVRFFTIPIEDATQAEPFVNQLRQVGFDVELKKAKDKPSIVVDLTTSKQTFK